LAEAVTVGFGFTVSVTVAVPVQPNVVPVTVYFVVVAGETVKGVPTNGPGSQSNVVPTKSLVTVRVELKPSQIVDGEATGVTTGLGLTVTVTVVKPVQPPFDMPLTV
jgi:hypothetical protein